MGCITTRLLGRRTACNPAQLRAFVAWCRRGEVTVWLPGEGEIPALHVVLPPGIDGECLAGPLVRSKNSISLFSQRLQSLQAVLFALNSLTESFILAVTVRGRGGGGTRHGLETTVSVYHGFGGPRDRAAQRLF